MIHFFNNNIFKMYHSRILHDNEASGMMKNEILLDYLSDERAIAYGLTISVGMRSLLFKARSRAGESLSTGRVVKSGVL